ncbi:MAG: radical SAM protein [Candidatus Eremiobacterota bacterium]
MNTNIKLLTINTSYNCNSSCMHCRYPGILNNRDFITPELLESSLSNLSDRNPEWIIIGGGEPFLRFDRLEIIIQVIKKILHRSKIHITTNGFWGTDMHQASEIAGSFVKSGVDSISFSVDSFHQKYISIEHVINSVKACLKAGLVNVSAGCLLMDSPLNNDFDSETKKFIKRLEEIQALKINTGTGLSMIGKAAEKLSVFYNKVSYNNLSCSIKPWDGGDFNLLTSITLDNYGFLTTCAGIAIGNVLNNNIKKILHDYNPLTHPIIKILISEGPAGLLELARKAGYTENDRFVDGCHCCFVSRQYLRTHYRGILEPSVCYK